MCFVPAGPSYTGDNKYQFSSSADTSTYEISSATTSETRQRIKQQGLRTILKGTIKIQETLKCIVQRNSACDVNFGILVVRSFMAKIMKVD